MNAVANRSPVARAIWRDRRRRLALVGIACLLGPATLIAQAAPDTLRLANAIAMVRQQSPMLAAARSEAEALRARIAPAGAMPDPTLTLGLMNRPLRGFGADEPMTMNQVQLSQELPWPGTLAAMRRQAGLLAGAEALAAAEVEVSLVAEMAQRYFAIAALDRTAVIHERTRDLLRDYFDVTTARYAVGDVPQQDVLQAQVAVASMTETLVVLAQRRVAEVARLNATLGRDARAVVAAVELPSIPEPLPGIDSLMALAAAGRPALRAAAVRVDAAEAGVAVARREQYPALMLGAAWNHRPAFDDMASLMVGIRLPVRPGSRQQPRILEMDAMAAMAAAMTTELTNQTWAALVEARAEAERARALTELYATAILPQASAAVEAALSAYRVGSVDYMTLVESQMTVNRYQVELVQLTATYHQAVARIHALTGTAGDAR
ncbi:MAG TPA: TolC family protein [Actinomycetota bacterium]|nr:TolC family protein [Actinomycetota bacterium]